jgi:hypothetical protein
MDEIDIREDDVCAGATPEKGDATCWLSSILRSCVFFSAGPSARLLLQLVETIFFNF